MIRVLKLTEQSIHWQLTRQSRRSIAFQFDQKGILQVKAPQGVTIKAIEDILYRYESKIMNNYEHYKKKASLLPKYATGDVFFYLGTRVTLRVIDTTEEEWVQVKGQELHCYCKVDSPEHVGSLLMNFYAQETLRWVTKSMEEYKEAVFKPVGAVRVKNQKSRWGSCSSKNNLNFNLRLSMMPLDVLKYVVIHELCHLKEMNHSVDFWKLVQGFMSDYKIKKRFLKEKGSVFMTYFS